MAFSHLIDHLLEDPGVASTLAALKQQSILIPDLGVPARAALTAAAITSHPGPTLVVASRADRAEELAAALAEYLPQRSVLAWPTPEALPYEQLPFDLQAATYRAALLSAVANPQTHPANTVVVTAARGLMQILMAPSELREATLTIRDGDQLSQDELLHWAVERGFSPAPIVYEPGQIARRGGILDLFPPGADEPYRIDFFGDEIDGIRPFDPHSQRSRDRLRELRLLPPADLPLARLRLAAEDLATLSTENLRAEVRTEWERTLSIMASGNTPPSLDLFAPYLLPISASLLDSPGSDALLVLDDPAAIDLIGSQFGRQAEELRDAFVNNGELPDGLRSPVVDWSGVRRTLAKRRSLALGTAWKGDKRRVFEVDVVEPPRFAGRLADVVDLVRERLFDGWRVVLATDQVDRLTELFEERDIFPRRERRRDASLAPTPLAPG